MMKKKKERRLLQGKVENPCRKVNGNTAHVVRGRAASDWIAVKALAGLEQGREW